MLFPEEPTCSDAGPCCSVMTQVFVFDIFIKNRYTHYKGDLYVELPNIFRDGREVPPHQIFMAHMVEFNPHLKMSFQMQNHGVNHPCK